MSDGHQNCHNFLDNKIRLIERLISHNVTDAEVNDQKYLDFKGILPNLYAYHII